MGSVLKVCKGCKCKDCSSNSHKGIPKRRLELSGKCRQRTNSLVSRLFRLPAPSVSSMCLFHQSVPSVCSISLFHQSVPSVCSTCLRLFHQSVPYVCSMRLFHQSVPLLCSIRLLHQSISVYRFACSLSLQGAATLVRCLLMTSHTPNTRHKMEAPTAVVSRLSNIFIVLFFIAASLSSSFFFFFFFFNHSVHIDRAHDGHLLGVPFKPDSLSPISFCKCIQLRAPPLPQCSVQNESIKDKRHSNRVARTLQLHFRLLFIPSWVLLRAQAFNTQNRTELTTLKILRDK